MPVVINSVEISAGQEPDSFEFATELDADFTISGRELSGMLGVQERVLEERIKKLTGKAAINALFGGKLQKEILDLIKPKATKAIKLAGDEQLGTTRFKYVGPIEFNTESSYSEATVTINPPSVTFSLQVSAIGEFMESVQSVAYFNESNGGALEAVGNSIQDRISSLRYLRGEYLEDARAVEGYDMDSNGIRKEFLLSADECLDSINELERAWKRWDFKHLVQSGVISKWLADKAQAEMDAMENESIDSATIVDQIHEALMSDDELTKSVSGEVDPEVMTYIKKMSSDDDTAMREITVRGNGKQLKTNKPKNGVYAYVWRMVRFHSGEDPTMPTTATWDLSREIQEKTGVKITFGITRNDKKKLLEMLDRQADRCLIALGLNPNGAANRWKRAFGY